METLISLLGGGLMRLLPEVLKLFTLKADQKHELSMMDKQFELAKLNAENAYRVQEKSLDSAEVLALLNAQGAALKGQMQKTGNKLADALNFLVRPLSTYYFLGCYGIVKTATIVVAMRGADPWTAILQCWTEQDATILTGILSFWFVGRAIEKK